MMAARRFDGLSGGADGTAVLALVMLEYSELQSWLYARTR